MPPATRASPRRPAQNVISGPGSSPGGKLPWSCGSFAPAAVQSASSAAVVTGVQVTGSSSATGSLDFAWTSQSARNSARHLRGRCLVRHGPGRLHRTRRRCSPRRVSTVLDQACRSFTRGRVVSRSTSTAYGPNGPAVIAKRIASAAIRPRGDGPCIRCPAGGLRGCLAVPRLPSRSAGRVPCGGGR